MVKSNIWNRKADQTLRFGPPGCSAYYVLLFRFRTRIVVLLAALCHLLDAGLRLGMG